MSHAIHLFGLMAITTSSVVARHHRADLFLADLGEVAGADAVAELLRLLAVQDLRGAAP